MEKRLQYYTTVLHYGKRRRWSWNVNRGSLNVNGKLPYINGQRRKLETVYDELIGKFGNEKKEWTRHEFR